VARGRDIIRPTYDCRLLRCKSTRGMLTLVMVPLPSENNDVSGESSLT